MNNQLFESLQKTGFWMRMIGFILGAFNALAWFMLVYYIISYDMLRWPFPTTIITIAISVSTVASIKAMQASFSIRNYIQNQDPIQLQKAFVHEGNFWNSLTLLCITGASTILLAYFRLL